ncbi:unnamed protein product [Porites evermanni]|uniref:Uncharacterized protein n=1 Tax=Porites evermanni TaxID=104178 RepID=A0ABN8N2K5_9CNID|nr:unnamed protein product [Porites evermanni]
MTLPETIEIARLLPENKLNKWKDVIDTFTLSESECDHTENQYINCTNLCEPVEKSGSRHFRCSCSDPTPTLTYNNRQWTCQGNGQVRSQLGCRVSTLFQKEEDDDRLRMLNTDSSRPTNLNRGFCRVSLNNSWYIGCHGEKLPLKENIKSFHLEWRGRRYHIQVLNDSSLRGRIINLGINCFSTAGPYRAGCLLFKLEGTLSCKKPPLYGFQSSTVPTVSLSSSIKTTPLTSTTTLESTATLESTLRGQSRMGRGNLVIKSSSNSGYIP